MQKYNQYTVTCDNIQKLEKCEKLKLIAGESGLSRQIKWVHYVEEMSYIKFVKGKELILTTGLLLKEQQKFLSFIEQLHKKGVSGIVINEMPDGIIPFLDDVVKLGNQIGLCIFSLPFHCRFIDISQSICYAIFLSEQHNHSREKLLSSLFIGEILNLQYAKTLLEEYGFLPHLTYVSISIQLQTLRTEQAKFLNASFQIARYIEYLQERIKRNILYLLQGHELLAILPVMPNEQSKDIHAICDLMISEISHIMHNATIYAGIGNQWDGLEGICASMTNAHNMAALAPFLNKAILDYAQCGIFHLLLNIPAKQIVHDAYRAVIQPLIDFDKTRRTDLTHTLFCFLENDCNLSSTAAKLFVHYNTLRYRLKTIENTLDVDLKSPKVISELMMALSIRRYLDYIEGY